MDYWIIINGGAIFGLQLYPDEESARCFMESMNLYSAGSDWQVVEIHVEVAL